MSIDHKRIYQNVVELHQDLIYEIGKCYLNKRNTERIFISFVQNLDFILYPNTVQTDDSIFIKEHKYDVNGDRLLPDIEVLNEEII